MLCGGCVLHLVGWLKRHLRDQASPFGLHGLVFLTLLTVQQWCGMCANFEQLNS